MSFPPTTFTVSVALPANGGGHDALSEYVETHWTAVIGPTATLTYRYMVRAARAAASGQETILTAGLAARFGVNNRLIGRAIERLVRFGLLSPTDISNIDHWYVELPGVLGSVPYRAARKIELAGAEQVPS